MDCFSAGFLEPFGETFYASRGVNQPLFARKEGMALGTNFEMVLGPNAAGLKAVSAGAFHRSGCVGGVYSCSHVSIDTFLALKIFRLNSCALQSGDEVPSKDPWTQPYQ